MEHETLIEHSTTKGNINLEIDENKETIPDSPLEIAKWIKDSKEEVKEGSDCILVTMDLPSGLRVGHDNLLKSLEIVLREYFITIPEDVSEKIAQGELDVFDFVAPARDNHLSPRYVEINTLPGISTLTIKGTPPEDGEDGFLEIFFDPSLKPGKLLPDGTIDFREVNRFPQASTDQHVLRVYEPTFGNYGTDVLGFPIKPKPGRPAQIKIGEGFYEKTGIDDKTSRSFKDYFSKKRGIIICSFKGGPSPKNLSSIAIKNELKVKDIDFSTGNIKGNDNEIRCKADVIVEGDIRGCFTVIIDGKLVVKGAVEGEAVDATGPVFINFAKNFVRSGSNIEVGIARNARLFAEGSLKIQRELSDGRLKAPKIFMEPKGTPEILVGRAKISTNEITGQGVNIRNIVEIQIGEELFDTLKQLLAQKEELSKELENKKDILKNRGAIFGQKLALAKSIIGKDQEKILQVFKQFASMILLNTISHKKIKERMATLQKNTSSELNMLIKHLKLMVEIQGDFEETQNKIKLLDEKIRDTKEAISNLSLNIKGKITDAGQIRILVNGKEKKITTKDLKSDNFHLKMVYSLDTGPKFKMESI